MQNEEVLVTFLHSSFLFYGCTNREFHLQTEEVTFNQHPDLFEAKETITCFQGKYPTSLVFFVTSRQIGALNLGALSPSTLRMNQMASKHQPFPNVLDNTLYNTLNPNLSINPAYLPGKKKWRSSARYMWIGVEGSLAIPRKPPLNPSFFTIHSRDSSELSESIRGRLTTTPGIVDERLQRMRLLENLACNGWTFSPKNN